MRKGYIGWIVWLLLMLGLVWLGTVPSTSTEPASSALSPGSYRGQITEIAADQSSLKVVQTDKPSHPTRDLVVPGKDDADRALRALLKSNVKGDLVNVTEAATQGKRPVLEKLDIQTREVLAWQRLLTLAGAAFLLLFFARASLGKSMGGLVRGLDGRTSNSKVQLVVWFGVVIVAYLSTLWLRFCYSSNLLLDSVDIPTNLLAISGLSALSFAGAKAITQGKQNALAAAGMEDAMKKPADSARPSSLSDLVLDDAGNPDIGDFQMLLVTLIAAITYCVQIFMFLGVIELRGKVMIPDVDGTLLAAFGLGQGAYLAKKAASGPKAPDVPPASSGAAAVIRVSPAAGADEGGGAAEVTAAVLPAAAPESQTTGRLGVES
jgi:hypothetical protein